MKGEVTDETLCVLGVSGTCRKILVLENVKDQEQKEYL